MLNPGFGNLSADQLRNYIETQKEEDYLLVDVRQPEEYAQAHIPGSKLMPLGVLESRLVDLSPDVNVVFYCRSGARSRTASLMAAGSGIALKKIYNLSGGIMAWNGATLADFPKVKVFENIEDHDELLLKSMDLEKGALRFYTYVVEKFAHQPFVQMIAPLIKAEKIHAQSIYRFWEKLGESPQPFEELFENLEGDILEGGEKLETIINRLESIEDNPCLGMIELALNVEYAAYDLYRTMADRTEDERSRRVFLSIAQVEKSHMQMLANAVEMCQA